MPATNCENWPGAVEVVEPVPMKRKLGSVTAPALTVPAVVFAKDAEVTADMAADVAVRKDPASVLKVDTSANEVVPALLSADTAVGNVDQ
jgi:hypothetical protein